MITNNQRSYSNIYGKNIINGHSEYSIIINKIYWSIRIGVAQLK